MATNLFVEDIDEMKRVIEGARAELSEFMSTVSAWEAKLTEQMKGIWEGEAYDKFRADFVKDAEGFKDTEEAMLALLRSASEARREYEAMEREIEGLNIVRA